MQIDNVSYIFCNLFKRFSSKKQPLPKLVGITRPKLFNLFKSKIVNYIIQVLDKKWLTHNVFELTLEKPESYIYSIGQAVDISVKNGSSVLKAPFTLTSIFENDETLKFIVKLYPTHSGITSRLARSRVNDTLVLSDAWDSFFYKGPGTFIAAGSGITPFIPVLRILNMQNKIEGHQLIFANKKNKDIILYSELKNMLNDKFHNILSKDHLSEHKSGRINKEYLAETITSIDQLFYLCGPRPFLKKVKRDLLELNVNENLIQTIY